MWILSRSRAVVSYFSLLSFGCPDSWLIVKCAIIVSKRGKKPEKRTQILFVPFSHIYRMRVTCSQLLLDSKLYCKNIDCQQTKHLPFATFIRSAWILRIRDTITICCTCLRGPSTAWILYAYFVLHSKLKCISMKI